MSLEIEIAWDTFIQIISTKVLRAKIIIIII